MSILRSVKPYDPVLTSPALTQDTSGKHTPRIQLTKKSNLDTYFTQEELEREKQLSPLSQKENDVLERIASLLVDMAIEEVQNRNR